MTAIETLVDADEEAEKQAAQIAHAEAMAHERALDLAWLCSEPRGRRLIRRTLLDGKLDVHSNHVASLVVNDDRFMAADEALRTRALRTLWPLVRGVAMGRIPLDALCALITEQDKQ